jgi:hemerythrin superfamily protein
MIVVCVLRRTIKMNNKISDIMLKDHDNIEKSFVKLKSKIEDSNFKEIFNEFRKKLENHFIMEENAILKSYNPQRYQYEMVQETINEHKEILRLMKRLIEELRDEETIDIKIFEDMLMEHKSFEDKIVYPKLDCELNEKEKKEIIEKINEAKKI